MNIHKGSSTFGFAQYIERHLITELNKIADESFLKGLERPRLVDRLTYFLSEINAADPFWEGNGRTQREFIRELALQSGYQLSWAKASREELYQASENSMRGDVSGLAVILNNALKP